MELTVRAAIRRIEEALAALYEPREARNIALELLARQNDTPGPAALLADPGAAVRCTEEELAGAIRRLAAGEPVQYLTGASDFFGRTFLVDRRVLIPRPETEELVDRILRDEPSARTILDVGTGSGCIAATLALELPAARVTAVDRSDGALEVAAENCRRLGADVVLRNVDALVGLEEAFDGPFDLIVSNPPYIPESDRPAMRRNVVDYEPAEALFVPDRDPLRFYRAIARAGRRLLAAEGALYFEIYEEAARELADLLADEGYARVRIREDLNGKPRIACARR